MTETKAGVCLGCGRPLPREHPAPNPHRLYHDAGCREMHERALAEFTDRNPEIPGYGRSPVKRPGAADRLRVVRASDGRLSVRFEKGPAKRQVRDHHGADTLPLAYCLAADAGPEGAAIFLRESYPDAEVIG